jgi:hypothetical protein
MNEREQFERNLEAARRFFGQLLDEPVARWPENGATILFLPEDDSALARANHDLARSLPDDQPLFHVTASEVVAPVTRHEPDAPSPIGGARG